MIPTTSTTFARRSGDERQGAAPGERSAGASHDASRIARRPPRVHRAPNALSLLARPARMAAMAMIGALLLGGPAVGAAQAAPVSAVHTGRALSATPAATDLYVTAVYQSLFERGPDPSGLSAWSNALLTGTPRVAVANGITYSPEYRTRLIGAAYEKYLGRAPEPSGLAGWLSVMGSGSTIQTMEAGFISSAEYVSRAGGTPAPWVAQLYADVLGRAASPAEVSLWTGALSRGGSLSQVAMGFLLSAEHLTTVIDGHYQHLLGRGIDPTGAAAWVSAIQAGGRVEAVIGGIVASDEYWARAAGAVKNTGRAVNTARRKDRKARMFIVAPCYGREAPHPGIHSGVRLTTLSGVA